MAVFFSGSTLLDQVVVVAFLRVLAVVGLALTVPGHPALTHPDRRQLPRQTHTHIYIASKI